MLWNKCLLSQWLSVDHMAEQHIWPLFLVLPYLHTLVLSLLYCTQSSLLGGYLWVVCISGFQ